MLYLGLDVHSKWMTVSGFDSETGELVHMKRVRNDLESIDEALSELTGPLFGVMESGTNSWAVYRMLEPYFQSLIVVDPATVWGREIRRGAKTDRRDAHKLAVKLYRGELEPLYVPDVETQDLRVLTRAKIHASRHVTKLVNETGSVLRSNGIVFECSLLSKKGQELITQSREKLPPHSQMVLDGLLGMLRVAQETEDHLEARIKAEANKDETCRILMSIPHVGPMTAMVIRAEVGDINRFATIEQFISYCGLAPKVLQSSESMRHGKLNRASNRYLKYVLVLRANGMARLREDNPLRQTYWRVMLKGTANNAKLVMARQLARVAYRMMKDGQCWDASQITTRRAQSSTKAA